ncbi:MAG: hypothetical protein GY800_00550 [Planctomycetes bacterium]|nr:hypothetical protein [Planctomycetota bacterium]
MAFIEYSAKGKVSTPRVGIGRHGTITLNGPCYKKWLKDIRYVVLCYDSDRQAIGLKPSNAETVNAYGLRRQRMGGAVVSGKAFLNYFGIKFDRAKRFDPVWNEADGLLEIKLDSSK